MQLVLPSGLVLAVRPIRAADKLLLQDGLNRLSRESVQQRFLSPKPRLTSRELRYLTEVDFADHYAIVAARTDRPDVIVATARWVREADDPEAAEVAVVIGDPLQGQGLGTALGRELARTAAEHGIKRFTATMAADNVAAHRLLARLTSQLDVVHAGPVDAVVAELAA